MYEDKAWSWPQPPMITDAEERQLLAPILQREWAELTDERRAQITAVAAAHPGEDIESIYDALVIKYHLDERTLHLETVQRVLETLRSTA